MTSFVALLRGVNVGGHRRVPMAELRALAEQLGLSDVRTYVASGNLIFTSDLAAAEIEKMLERAIEERFGFAVDVLVRTGAQWMACCAANPMPAQSARQPNLVMATIARQTPTAADVAALRVRAGPNERVVLSGDAVWIYFGDGAGRSKLGAGPARHVATTRNWRTMVKIREMIEP